MAGDVDRDPNSWISKLYKTMKPEDTVSSGEPFNGSLPEGLESPILDENWGLGQDLDQPQAGVFKIFKIASMFFFFFFFFLSFDTFYALRDLTFLFTYKL